MNKKKDYSAGVTYGLAAGLACGLVVGAVAGLLFAPASGAETRRRLLYERERAAEAARAGARRAMARLQVIPPAEGAEEEEELFIGV